MKILILSIAILLSISGQLIQAADLETTTDDAMDLSDDSAKAITTDLASATEAKLAKMPADKVSSSLANDALTANNGSSSDMDTTEDAA